MYLKRSFVCLPFILLWDGGWGLAPSQPAIQRLSIWFSICSPSVEEISGSSVSWSTTSTIACSAGENGFVIINFSFVSVAIVMRFALGFVCKNVAASAVGTWWIRQCACVFAALCLSVGPAGFFAFFFFLVCPLPSELHVFLCHRTEERLVLVSHPVFLCLCHCPLFLLLLRGHYCYCGFVVGRRRSACEPVDEASGYCFENSWHRESLYNTSPFLSVGDDFAQVFPRRDDRLVH